MSTPSIKTRVELDGEKEYKQAVSEINSGLKVLRSEMKLSSEAFAENADSVEALTAKGDILERQILSQKEKVSTLEAALKSSAQSYGESDKRTQDWQISLNQAETELLKIERALRENQEALKNSTEAADEERKSLEEMQDALGETEDQSKSFGDVLADIAGKLGVDLPDGAKGALDALGQINGKTALLAGSATAAAGALIKVERALMDLTKERASAATTISNISQTIGMSVEATQEWDYVLKTLGSSIEEAQGDLSAFQEKMLEALSGEGEEAEMFTALGVNVKEFGSNALRPTEDVLLDVIHSLQLMDDQTKRNAISSTLLGGTGEKLIPIYEQNAEALDGLMQKKHELGIMSDYEIEVLQRVNAEMIDYEEKMKSAKNVLAVEFAPSLEAFYDTAGTGIKDLAEATAEAGIIEALGSFIELLGALVPLLNMLEPVIRTTGAAFDGIKVTIWAISDAITYLSEKLGGLAKVWSTIFAENTVGTWIPSPSNNIFSRLWRVIKSLTGGMDSGNVDGNAGTNRGTGGSSVSGKFDYYNASGTHNFPGGYTWVGENGPEKIWLPQGTQIQSAQASRMSGGDTYYITIDASSVREFSDIVRIVQNKRRTDRMGEPERGN